MHRHGSNGRGSVDFSGSSAPSRSQAPSWPTNRAATSNLVDRQVPMVAEVRRRAAVRTCLGRVRLAGSRLPTPPSVP